MEWISVLEALERTGTSLEYLVDAFAADFVRARYRLRDGHPLIPARRWRESPESLGELNRIVEVHLGDLLAAFGPADPASTPERRGRKPDGRAQWEEIVRGFRRMVDEDQVSYAHGGRRAAARVLLAQFPDYQLKSIEGIIGPEYQQAKAKNTRP
jgi:hypothetical protein